MLFVVAYDISADNRRDKVAQELKNWGTRVQYSVWECDLEPDDAARMAGILRKMIADGDGLRVYRLCALCEEHSVAIGGEFPSDASYYQV
ncbi:MAG: CRISPR-associated endonuclease Cas2 [Blastocatellia bacterium]